MRRNSCGIDADPSCKCGGSGRIWRRRRAQSRSDPRTPLLVTILPRLKSDSLKRGIPLDLGRR